MPLALGSMCVCTQEYLVFLLLHKEARVGAVVELKACWEFEERWKGREVGGSWGEVVGVRLKL
jgi:hypothetical protein